MECFEKKSSLLLVLLLLSAIITCSTGAVKAESHTIVVPDNYPTIESALNSATDGDIIYVRNGTYDGPMNQTLSVKKTVTIMGENRDSTIIRLFGAYNETWIFATCLPTYTDALTIEGDNCRILNLTLIPRGYIAIAGDNVQIIGNNITYGQSVGLSVSGSNCRITDNVYDGYLSLNGSNGYIGRNNGLSINVQGNSNIIKNNTCQFISLNNATNNVLASNRISSDLSYSGISVDHSSSNVFVRNSITWYTYGFAIWQSSDNLIASNTIAKCFHSVAVGGSSNNRFYLNNFVDNEPWSSYVYDQYADPPLRDANPSIRASTNLWDNGTLGNYWQNYTGTDTDRNGILDLPYELTGVYYTAVGEDSIGMVLGQDNYPLALRVNIADVNVELPEWASSMLERNESTIALPSIEPTIPPSSGSQETEQPQGQIVLYATLISVAVSLAAIVLAISLYRKKGAAGLSR